MKSTWAHQNSHATSIQGEVWPWQVSKRESLTERKEAQRTIKEISLHYRDYGPQKRKQDIFR